MNQERRNKRNAQYKINLEKRYGITKKSDYLSMVSDGIEKSKTRNPMDGHYEFTLTRKKKGNIGSREKFVYRWTAQAKALQKLYHDTKDGIEAKPNKPIEKFFDKEHTKEEIKEYFNKKKTEKKKDYVYNASTKSFVIHEVDPNDRKFSSFHYKLVEGLYLNKKEDVILQTAAAQGAHNAKIEAFMKKNLIKKGQEPLFKLAKKSNSKEITALGIAA